MFSDPKNNIKQFSLKDGDIVADLGSGQGYYSLSASTAVGANGKVYAIDIDSEILKRLKSETDSKKIKNLEIITGDLERVGGIKLGDASCDAVIAANVFFQVRNKDAFVKEIRRVLKPHGRVLVIDWKDSFSGMGPAKNKLLLPDMARHFFEVHDFIYMKDILAGEHHYGIIFKKQGE